MNPIPFPFNLTPYRVADLRISRDQLREQLGTPHYVETESMRTFGGDEDMWGYELESGQKFAVVLRVPYECAIIYADPPNARPVLLALNIQSDSDDVHIHDEPILLPEHGDT